MAEILSKPTLFDFGPSLNKNNMAKNSKGSFFQKISKIHLFFIKIWVKSKKKRSSLFFLKNIFLLLRNDPRKVGICFQLFTVIFEIFRAILKNKDNMAPKSKDNIAKSQLSL
jgi:hypothetical protein